MAISIRTQFTVSTLCLLLFVVGCAGTWGPTKYEPEYSWGMGQKAGYTDIQITADTFQVSFKGNAHLSDQTAYNYCLYRSAEVTKEHGFDYFVILEEKDLTYSVGGSQVVYGTATIQVRNLPGYNFRIKTGKGVKPDRDKAYYAKEIIKSFESKIIRP